jgi:hypothetical protein
MNPTPSDETREGVSIENLNNETKETEMSEKFDAEEYYKVGGFESYLRVVEKDFVKALEILRGIKEEDGSEKVIENLAEIAGLIEGISYNLDDMRAGAAEDDN